MVRVPRRPRRPWEGSQGLCHRSTKVSLRALVRAANAACPVRGRQIAPRSPRTHTPLTSPEAHDNSQPRCVALPLRRAVRARPKEPRFASARRPEHPIHHPIIPSTGSPSPPSHHCVRDPTTPIPLPRAHHPPLAGARPARPPRQPMPSPPGGRPPGGGKKGAEGAPAASPAGCGGGRSTCSGSCRSCARRRRSRWARTCRWRPRWRRRSTRQEQEKLKEIPVPKSKAEERVIGTTTFAAARRVPQAGAAGEPHTPRACSGTRHAGYFLKELNGGSVAATGPKIEEPVFELLIDRWRRPSVPTRVPTRRSSRRAPARSRSSPPPNPTARRR